MKSIELKLIQLFDGWKIEMNRFAELMGFNLIKIQINIKNCND